MILQPPYHVSRKFRRGEYHPLTISSPPTYSFFMQLAVSLARLPHSPSYHMSRVSSNIIVPQPPMKFGMTLPLFGIPECGSSPFFFTAKLNCYIKCF